MSRLKSAFALAIALSFPAFSYAGPGAGPAKKEVKKAQPKLNASDLATLQHHHDVNVMEIEMATVAQQRGTAAVKKYAAMLLKDHKAADKLALDLAKARGVALTEHAMPASEIEQAEHKKQMDTMDRLSTLEGKNFDQEYLSAMVDGHSAELGYLSVAIADAADAKLKAHLEKVKPTIEKHADEASKILDDLNAAPVAPAPAKGPK